MELNFSRTRSQLFSLERGVTFGLACVLMVAALVAVNNYYYYKSIEFRTGLDHQIMLRTLESAWHICQEGEEPYPICRYKLVDTIKRSGWVGRVIVSGSNDQVVLDSLNQQYREKRTSVVSHSVMDWLSDPDKNLTVVINQKVAPYLWLSVVRSMTFSAGQIIELSISGESTGDIKRFIVNVAWPRSRPALFYWVAVIMTLWLIRRRVMRLQKRMVEIDEQRLEGIEKLRKNEEAQDVLTEHLLRSEEERKKNESEVNQIEMRIQALESEQAAGATEAHETEIMRLRKKLGAASERISEIIAKAREYQSELTQKEKVVIALRDKNEVYQSQIESLSMKTGGAGEGSKSKLANVLLRNPDVPFTMIKRTNGGAHHSKDFVGKVSEQVLANRYTSRLIESIFPGRYQDAKRASLMVTWDDKKGKFVATVVDKGDEGFSAVLVLNACNHWQAMAEAKCLVQFLPMLKGYEVVDKIKPVI